MKKKVTGSNEAKPGDSFLPFYAVRIQSPMGVFLSFPQKNGLIEIYSLQLKFKHIRVNYYLLVDKRGNAMPVPIKRSCG